jgi:hypothetical protein
MNINKLKNKMKKIAALFLIVASFPVIAQENLILDKPKVDKRVELLSIVFRLADNPEYGTNLFKLYTDKIENHFNSYKDHQLIRFTKEIMGENGIGYDAVMQMAIHIDENLNPLVEFTDNVPESRWGKENADKFITLLKEFYKEAKCDEFFKANDSLYTEVNKRFLPVYERLDLNWYSSFYGKEPTEKFIIVNGLANGGNSYGPSLTLPNGKKEVYAIIGTWRTDSLGMAVFNINEYFPNLLHEFNHSFVNCLLEKNGDAFKANGEKIFEQVKEEMRRQHYAYWETVLNEALVRASVIKYMKDHNFDKPIIDNEINNQLAIGFLWIRELVAELENYGKNREIYPTLESYMPKLATAYTVYASNIDKYAQQIEDEKPEVVSINEFKNGDTHVDASIQTITVNFNKPLSGIGYSIFYGDKGIEAFPKFGNITYSEDKKSVILMVQLESDKEYQFILTGKSFKSEDGVGIKSYEINFRTKK